MRVATGFDGGAPAAARLGAVHISLRTQALFIRSVFRPLQAVPVAEPELSATYRGLCAYVARLLQPAWELPLFLSAKSGNLDLRCLPPSAGGASGRTRMVCGVPRAVRICGAPAAARLGAAHRGARGRRQRRDPAPAHPQRRPAGRLPQTQSLGFWPQGTVAARPCARTSPAPRCRRNPADLGLGFEVQGTAAARTCPALPQHHAAGGIPQTGARPVAGRVACGTCINTRKSAHLAQGRFERFSS